MKNIFKRYSQSVNIQMSSEKILSFLVNDILDYAQISAGKFRKFFHKFNLNESVDEILLVMKNKAD